MREYGSNTKPAGERPAPPPASPKTNKAFAYWFASTASDAADDNRAGWNAAIAHAVRVLREEAENRVGRGPYPDQRSRREVLQDVADRLERGE